MLKKEKLRNFLHRLSKDIARARYAFVLLRLSRQGDVNIRTSRGEDVPILERFLEDAVIVSLARIFDDDTRSICLLNLLRQLERFTESPTHEVAAELADEVALLVIEANPLDNSEPKAAAHVFKNDHLRLMAEAAAMSGLAHSLATLRKLRNKRVAHSDSGPVPSPLPSVTFSEIDAIIERAAGLVAKTLSVLFNEAHPALDHPEIERLRRMPYNLGFERLFAHEEPWS